MAFAEGPYKSAEVECNDFRRLLEPDVSATMRLQAGDLAGHGENASSTTGAVLERAQSGLQSDAGRIFQPVSTPSVRNLKTRRGQSRGTCRGPSSVSTMKR
jgi:hypothetical protein